MKNFSNYKTVILANGEFPTHELPLHLLRSAEHLVCCDGAINNLAKTDIEPTVIIGDFDSLSEDNRQRYQSRLLSAKSQELCDLHKAILYAIEHYDSNIAIVGATGLREDHTLANISLLMTYAPQRNMIMATDFGVFYPAFQTITLPSYPGEQISIFSFQQDTKFTFKNLRFPVSERAFTHLWEAALNEALADNFTIEFEDGKALIYCCY